ncbi:hypothetical protein AB4Z01_15120 [Inquilinus sp. YAF38]|uniref:hypothetical protein n=1 Tax=Inquilinus sp. YAF38 TaxID=3233084 RepID=UPI003F8DA715
MANGHDKADWSVEFNLGSGGSVRCGRVVGVFSQLLSGGLRIVWKAGFPTGPDGVRMQKAAEEAVQDALNRRMP